MSDTPARTFSAPSVRNALPFWAALILVPTAAVGPVFGGVWVVLVIFLVWNASAFIDAALGSDAGAFDPETDDGAVFWHWAVTLVWPVLQTVILLGTIAYVPRAAHLGPLEIIGITVGLGIISGAVGIVFAHELMHQQSRVERWLGDILMSQVLYSHFRSEHLLVHHRYVGTPADQVTARKGETFYRFFGRVLPGVLRSSWEAEKLRLEKRERSVWHPSNPFWRYGALQLFWLVLAVSLGGLTGLLIFLGQAFVAVFQLELINYIEHYGLTRKHLGEGRYEPTRPHHSWNDNHTFTRGFLINLTRHSDHHAKPSRRFPLLQSYDETDAPMMPYGYTAMTGMALIPPLWQKVMHPRLKAWRARHYPEIEDWMPYNRHETPMPR